MVFCVSYIGLHTIVIIDCVFGAEWGAISTMINDAFGYPELAAVALYLGGGQFQSERNSYS